MTSLRYVQRDRKPYVPGIDLDADRGRLHNAA